MDSIRRALGDGPPPIARTRLENNPTLLFSWWCTGMALTIILFRLAGRLVRTERLFREDKIMAWSIIPLVGRMACAHFVLRFGTNNVDLSTVPERQFDEREIGSKLVLCARIFFAMFIWTSKFTISEFLKRLTERFWKRSYEIMLASIRIFLAVSFVGVVIATLAECQPFDHYWQVSPDPGPRCRLGYANLITMGAADMISDILLVVFPIPIVIGSAMPVKRKISLCLLFSMSGILIAITGVRVPKIILKQGRQQYRTVWASCEILAAAAISNAVVLGSFLRDRGVKKAKRFKLGSGTDSIDRGSLKRGPVMQARWGSDEDLFRDMGIMGIKVDPELRAEFSRPNPINLPTSPTMSDPDQVSPTYLDSRGHNPARISEEDESELKAIVSHESPLSPGAVPGVPRLPRLNFFDVGGLLENGPGYGRNSSISSQLQSSVQDFAAGARRGSKALLSDLGGLVSSPGIRRPSNSPAALSGRKLSENPAIPSIRRPSENPPIPSIRRPSENPATTSMRRPSESPATGVERRRSSRSPAAPGARRPSRSPVAPGDRRPSRNPVAGGDDSNHLKPPSADAEGGEEVEMKENPTRSRSVSRARVGQPIPPTGVIVPRITRHETDQSLKDVGNLLEEEERQGRGKPKPSSRASSMARSLNLVGRIGGHGSGKSTPLTGSREHSRTRGTPPLEEEGDSRDSSRDRKQKSREPPKQRLKRSETPQLMDAGGLLN